MNLLSRIRYSTRQEKPFLAATLPPAVLFVALLVAFGEPGLASVYDAMPGRVVVPLLTALQVGLVVALVRCVWTFRSLSVRHWVPGMRHVVFLHFLMIAFLCGATAVYLTRTIPGTMGYAASEGLR